MSSIDSSHHASPPPIEGHDHGPANRGSETQVSEARGPAPREATAERRGRGPSITLGICLAAGVAAGIGLLRPGVSTDTGTAPPSPDQPVVAGPATTGPQAAGGGYGSGEAIVGQEGGTPSPGPSAPAATAIDIADFSFGAPTNSGAAQTVTVTNRDAVAHTLTSSDGLFDTGTIGAATGATFTAPSQPGTYSFFCAIHPSMQGTLTVGS